MHQTLGTLSLALQSFTSTRAPPTHANSWLDAPRAPATGAPLHGVPKTNLSWIIVCWANDVACATHPLLPAKIGLYPGHAASFPALHPACSCRSSFRVLGRVRPPIARNNWFFHLRAEFKDRVFTKKDPPDHETNPPVIVAITTLERSRFSRMFFTFILSRFILPA